MSTQPIPTSVSAPLDVPSYVEHAPFGARVPVKVDASDYEASSAKAVADFEMGKCYESIDAFEQILHAHPRKCVPLLAKLYDLYQVMPGRQSRYFKYQARHFHFGIKPGDRVLDIGSGHNPLPTATHLAEYAVFDNAYGRAGTPFAFVAGKPVTMCSVEALPFPDKYFDFVYCSHVLEHVRSPESACNELMRVGKRGYFESPTRPKDLWLHQAGISNHTWSLQVRGDIVTFDRYTPEDIEGLDCDVLMKMAVDPRSDREKAFSAMLFLKAPIANAMMLWDGAFKCEVRR